MKKRLLAGVLTLVLALGGVTGCSPKQGGNTDQGSSGGSGKPVEIWSFLNQEEMNYYKEVYEKLRPNSKVNVTVFPGDQYLTKVQSAFRSGSNAPDIVYLEIAHLGQFKETDMLETLDQDPYKGQEILDKQIPYVTELSKNSKDELKGISWQATPGGFWYRKDLAEKYLGVKEPEEFQALVSDWDKIIETGKKVYEASNGKVALLDDAGGGVGAVMLNTKGGPWVDEKNNLISMDPLKATLEVTKAVRDNNVDAKVAQWTPGWAAGMFNEEKFIITGLPSWGLHYCIKANTPPEKMEEAKDMWGFVQAPAAYQSGGTWMGMYSKSENKEAAWDYIYTMTADEDYLVPYLIEDLGDFTAYIPAIETAISNKFRDPFTGDQDVYGYLYEAAKNVEYTPMTKYDSQAGSLFGTQRDLVLENKISIDQALEQFKKDMKNEFPEINID